MDELHRLSIDPTDWNGGGALSLAKLPLDRFVAVDAGVAGQVLTKPFMWTEGEDLYINADSKWGKIYVEIVDGDSRRPFGEMI
jgi:hypothetical protein